MTTVDSAIKRVQQRHALLAAFAVLQTLLAYGLGFFIVWISLARLTGIIGPTVGLGCWLFVVILATSGITGWMRRPDRARSAWLLDTALESQNLFGTLLDLPGDSIVRDHLEEQADTLANALHPPTAFPALCSRTGRWLWIPTTLLIAALFIPAKDPFGWRDQRIRQEARDRAVAAAEKVIDEKLADSAISTETREFLEQTKEDLDSSMGEQEVAAALAQMAEAAAETENKELQEAADNVLQDAVEAAGAESAVAAAASVATSDQTAKSADSADSDKSPSDSSDSSDAAGSKTADNNPNGSKATDGGGDESAQAGSSSESGSKPGDGGKAASQASNGGEASASAGSKPANGGESSTPGSSQANSAGNGGTGSGGIGEGGGQAATGGSGAVSFRDVMVEGKRVNDHTIEELIRIEDDEADQAATKRTFVRAKTAAAAHANAAMSRTRIPSNAQAAVRGYFEALAKPE